MTYAAYVPHVYPAYVARICPHESMIGLDVNALDHELFGLKRNMPTVCLLFNCLLFVIARTVQRGGFGVFGRTILAIRMLFGDLPANIFV